MAHWERLSALDAHFLDLEDRGCHMHTGAVLIFERGPLERQGGVDIERIRDFVADQLDRIPRYRQRLAWIPVERHPVWVDDAHFNLQFHVRHTSLPHPGDERQLKRLTGLLLSQKLDRGKPLWEMWVVEGLAGGRVALVVKVHHCMVDGIGSVEMLAAMVKPEGFEADAGTRRWRPRPQPGPARLLAGDLARRAGLPFALARAAARAASDPVGSVRSGLDTVAGLGAALAPTMHPASETPLNPPHIGPHRRFDWARFDFEAVRDVKHRLGGTVNDVVLATAAGGVGRFLRQRGLRVSRELDFRALVPVNLRPRSSAEPGNRVATLIARLPVHERDPRRRLELVSETMRDLKRSSRVRGAELLEEVSDWTATSLVTQTMRLAFARRAFNLVVTNVPGPRIPMQFLGAPLREIYPVVHLYPNQALGIALFTYHGGLHWGVNADWDRVPDLHDFVEGLTLEFEALRKAAATAPPPEAEAPSRS